MSSTKMRLLLIASFLALLGLVATCPPPFNDVYFLGNETHSTSDLIQGLLEAQPPGTAWADIVTTVGNPRRTWPHGRITYCFADEHTRINYGDDVQEAWRLWAARLGDPGPANGYQLTFTEHVFAPNVWPYCFNRRDSNNPLIWNPHVAGDTLLITERDVSGAGNSATTGYIPPYSPTLGPREGRHALNIGKDERASFPLYESWIADIAHELGHVIGFWHEHQRPDRDHHVYFNCKALKDYDSMKVVAEDKGLSMDQICADGNQAASIGFYAVNGYDKLNHLDPTSTAPDRLLWWIQNYPAPYDDTSIMQYYSWPYLGYENNDAEKLHVPLAFWKNRGPNFNPPAEVNQDDLEFIRMNEWPSPQDIEGVKILYPAL